MTELFSSDFGIMLSALLIFVGMTDFMMLILFFSSQKPRMRVSDITNITPIEEKLVKKRMRRYKAIQFIIAMSGLLMVTAGMYGIAAQLTG